MSDVLLYMRKRALEHAIPISVLFEVTSVCNMRCRHCYIADFTQRGMPTAKVCSVLDELAAAGTFFLTLTGGEILTRRDIFEIIAHAASRNFALTLFTNGTLLDAEKADRIAAAHPQSVEMSLLGADAATHDQLMARPGSFERVLRALRLLRERNVHVAIKTTLMRDNVEQFARMKALVESYGASYAWDPVVTPRRDGSRKPLELAMSDMQYQRWVREQEFTGAQITAMQGCPSADLAASEHMCSAGTTSCRIDANGKVYPCVEILVPAGDLAHEPFGEIWQRGAIFGQMRQAHVEDYTCGSCAMMKGCVRTCPGLFLQETGSLFTPPARVCDMTKQRYSALSGEVIPLMVG
jgi:radical SAM protein with 4Fe4S-binding SPASM domain